MIGSCFYYSFSEVDHLWVVIAPSLDKPGCFICVNATTKRETSDLTCELRQGEHPALTVPVSIIAYGHARELPQVLIERLTREQKVAPMPPAVLLKIQRAPLNDESRLSNKFKAAIAQYLNKSG